MTTTTDERSFLARIAANPADDTDRLVYADWLDEHGGEVTCPKCVEILSPDRGGCWPCHACGAKEWAECGRVPDGRRERAEFIRDGVEAARNGMEHYQPLDPQATDWRRAGVCAACRGVGAFVTSTRANTLTDACPHCWGSGDVGGLLRAVSAEWNGGGRFDTAVPLRVGFERGFPAAVHCAMSDVVDAAGVPTSWARAVVKYHPVTRFVVGDRTPHEGMPGWQWQCPAADPHGRHPADLPRAVFDSLAGFARDSPAENCRDNLRAVFLARRIYSTRDSANDALHTALARLAAGS